MSFIQKHLKTQLLKTQHLKTQHLKTQHLKGNMYKEHYLHPLRISDHGDKLRSLNYGWKLLLVHLTEDKHN